MPINFLEKDTEHEYFVDRPEVKALLCFIAGISVVCFLLVTTSDGWLKKNAIENFQKAEVRGKVTLKALDSKNRDTPYVLIRNKRHYISDLTWNKVVAGGHKDFALRAQYRVSQHKRAQGSLCFVSFNARLSEPC